MKTTCARCNKEKENPHTKSSYCKKCHNEKIKEWKANNPEKAKLIKQREAQKNKNKYIERATKWQQENKDRRRDINATWRWKKD